MLVHGLVGICEPVAKVRVWVCRYAATQISTYPLSLVNIAAEGMKVKRIYGYVIIHVPTLRESLYPSTIGLMGTRIEAIPG